MSNIKKKFAGFVNQIAVDLGLMDREQSVQILSVQASFLALAEKQIKPTAKFLDSDPLFEQVRDSWESLAQENQISETDFLHHYARASSGQGLEKDEAPAAGDIAGALGLIPKHVKHAILTAQAAVRAEKALADIENPQVEPKSAEDIERQHGRIDHEGKFDPTELVSAQINNKAADNLHREIKEGLIVEKAADQRKDYVSRQTKEAYHDAAQMFSELGIPAARHISQELERAAQSMEMQK